MSDNINTKFGVLKYSSINIGDEIQSIAAMRFLPEIDYYIQRERVDQFKSENGEKVKLFMNAWWMWDYKHFPPSSDIDPLFVSFHLREKIRTQFSKKFMKKKVIAYFKQHEPIGCRDTTTAAYLKDHGIDAFFSGCMTMILLPNHKIKELYGNNYVLCVDVPSKMVNMIRKKSEKPVYSISRMISPAFKGTDRLRVAKYILYLYHNVSCVVTPRLHVALPSVAFQTPVCLVGTKTKNFEVLSRRGRFDGLEGFFNEVLYEDYIKGKSDYDINHPLPNPQTYIPMRDKLVQMCTELSGYDSQKPVFEDDYNPLVEMAEMLKYDPEVIDKVTMFASSKTLLKTVFNQKILGKSRHDVLY